MKRLTEILKITAAPILLASMCCLSPLIFVLLGVSSISFATSLADNLYGNYKWLFRSVGLISMLLSLAYYLYQKKGICTLEQAKRRRNEILNYLFLSITVCVLGYIFFLYVVVHYAGVALKIWP